MELMEQISEAKRQALSEQWRQLAAPYASAVTDAAWQKLQQAYLEPGRHYHNLNHICALLNWAEQYQAQLQQYDAVRFAVWYHDAVYHTRQQDNEERSAELAAQELQRLNVPPATIHAVEALIRATKTHQVAAPADGQTAGRPDDTRWFLDFDLAILGSRPAIYRAYSQAIRREYGWVPSLLYRRGRRQVLEGFLKREQLFFTEEMRNQLEAQARTNLGEELTQLN
jgi:predicted metal-dependent HD superfamily phosphohydrolase